MKRFVVDASVAIKWFIPEVHDLAALRFVINRYDLIVPDLFLTEMGNILW